MQHMKNKNGFTIIELIMVMIIIGVLAAVAIPRFQDIVVESEVAVEQRAGNAQQHQAEQRAQGGQAPGAAGGRGRCRGGVSAFLWHGR